MGNDLASVTRMAASLDRFGSRFAERIFTQTEQDWAAQSAASFALCWAAKEAAAKALGTGLPSGSSWKDISVLPTNTQLSLHLVGWARAKLIALMPDGHEPAVHFTYSVSIPWAEATVLIEARRTG